MNQYFRSLANSAASRYKIVTLTDDEVEEVMQRNNSQSGGDQSIVLPVLTNNNSDAVGHGQMTARSQQQSDMVINANNVNKDTTNHEDSDYDEDMIHPGDSEWLQKIELDLAQAARLEQDLQMLCALRQQPPPKEGGKKTKKGDDSGLDEFRKTNTRETRDHDLDSNNGHNNLNNNNNNNPNNKLANFHHNSRVLDNLKIEGKNSFGIPCTDIFEDDFEDELNFLLRNHRHTRYSRGLPYPGDQQPPSHLYLSGTSLNKKRLIAITSQIPMRMRDQDLLIREETASPLFADVTPVTPTKSRPPSMLRSARKKTPTNTFSTSSGGTNNNNNNYNNNVDTASVLGAVAPSVASSGHFPPSPSAHLSTSVSQAMPVTHNSFRTSLLGGSLPPKPTKKLFRNSLPVNNAAVLQVQMTCNSNGVLADDGLSKQPQVVSSTDCCSGPLMRSSTFGCPRIATHSLVPRLWVLPAWPKSQFQNNKQPFKQLRRQVAQRNGNALMPLETSQPANSDQEIASRIIRNNMQLKEPLHKKFSRSRIPHDELPVAYDDTVDEYNNSQTYWSNKPSLTAPGGQYRQVPAPAVTPSFERSSTQMSLGSILNVIRSVNETLGTAVTK